MAGSEAVGVAGSVTDATAVAVAVGAIGFRVAGATREAVVLHAARMKAATMLISISFVNTILFFIRQCFHDGQTLFSLHRRLPYIAAMVIESNIRTFPIRVNMIR